MSDARTLYQRVILKHARAPVGLNRKLNATHRASADNPLCGDDVRLELEVADDTIRLAAYHGEFCAVCSASASLLCEHAAGKPLAVFEALSKDLLAGLDGDAPPAEFPEDLRALLAVRQFPVRIRCAALPWRAARTALGVARVV